MQKLNKNKNIFDHRDCLTKEELVSYAKGTLSEKAKHHVEKHLLDCELCTEALEGVSLMDDPASLNKISSDMIRRMGDEKLFIKKNKTRPAYLAAAAVVCLFILSGIYLAFIRNPENLKTEVAVLPAIDKKPAEPPSPSVSDSTGKLTGRSGNFKVTETKREAAGTFEPQDKKEALQTGTSVTLSSADNHAAAEQSPLPPPSVTYGYNDATAASEKAKEEIIVAENKKEVPVAAAETETPDDKLSKNNDQGPAPAESQAKMKVRLMEDRQKNAERNNLKVAGNSQTNVNDALKDVQKKMDNENFKDALSELKKLAKEHPGDMNVIYKTGLVYYETNETAKALGCFTEVLNSGDKKLFEDARIHQALTYVKMNDKENARKILNKIIADKSIYKERAEGILEQMDDH